MRIGGADSSIRNGTVDRVGQVVLDGSSVLVFTFKDDDVTYFCKYNEKSEYIAFLQASLLKRGDKVVYAFRPSSFEEILPPVRLVPACSFGGDLA